MVEEILEEKVNLLVSSWPTVDEDGRLAFKQEAPLSITATKEQLERFLGSHRLPAELRDRPLRIGDTFAFRANADLRTVVGAREEPLEPGLWIAPPVYDISADAREAAKLAFYGAVTPTLDRAQAMRIEEIVERPQPALQLGGRVRPGGRLPLRWLAAGTALGLVGLGAGVVVAQAVDGRTTVAGTTSRVTSVSTSVSTTVSTTVSTSVSTTTAVRTRTVTTLAPTKPDLTVALLPDGIQFSCSTATLTRICATRVSFLVANVGGNDVTEAFDVSISAAVAGATVTTPTQTVDALPAGQVVFLDAQFPESANCTSPDCTITVEVDAGSAIAESNEKNNTATGSPPPPPG